MTDGTHFDGYAENYDAVLDDAISISGEDKNYFARGRIAWLADCLRQLQVHPKSAMDFGCGTGSASPLLLELLGVESVAGIDVSSRSLDVARRAYASERTQFLLSDEYQPSEQIDLVFCNGVFHHIWPNEREAAVSCIHRSLRPGGLFAFWENNPWNPGMRFVMSRCRFDADAITVSPPAARRLLRAGGFEILRTDFLFVFPRALKSLRGMERFLSRFPFGAQFQVLCRKPPRVRGHQRNNSIGISILNPG